MTQFDGSWQLVAIETPQVVSPAVARSQATLVIQPATDTPGAVAGNASCNRYRAQYQMNGSALTIGPAAVTRMACPDPAITAQEAQVLRMLGAVTGWEMRGDQLVLVAGNERLVWEPGNDQGTRRSGRARG